MKFIKLLPYKSELDGDLLDCALWQSEDTDNHCELKEEDKKCDDSGFYYGTSDEYEPKFCARHFYQEAVSGDGKSNYKLSDAKVIVKDKPRKQIVDLAMIYYEDDIKKYIADFRNQDDNLYTDLTQDPNYKITDNDIHHILMSNLHNV